MKVLVTGATGIVGGWLTKALVERGDQVVGLLRDETPRSNFHLLGLEKKVSIVRGTLENADDVMRAFNEYEIEVCFHLGAQTQVGVGNRHPVSTFEANIRGSWNVLEAARQHFGLKRLVMASSDKAYGALDTLPYTEDMPLRGSHPYDASKSCVDLLGQCYLKTYRLPIAIVRCGNIYGGGDYNWNRIVPGTIRSVLHGEPPIIRSDGRMLRDYLYVGDAVSAYLALGDSEQTGAWNFGTETPTDVLTVVTKILELMDSNLCPLIRNEASNEIERQWLSASKARTMLGWKPAFTLNRGLGKTIEWYRTHLEGPWKS